MQEGLRHVVNLSDRVGYVEFLRTNDSGSEIHVCGIAWLNLNSIIHTKSLHCMHRFFHSAIL